MHVCFFILLLITDCGDILVNNYAPATMPAWAGGSGTPGYPGPVLYNCQKQLIFSGAVLSSGSRPPSPECTNATGMAFAQWQVKRASKR